MDHLPEEERLRREIVFEKLRRDEFTRRVWTDHSFERQREFCLDPAKKKAALCTRRAGKSNGAALKILDVAYSRPGANILYIGLTEKTAHRIIWKDCLQKQARALGKHVQCAEGQKRITFGGSPSIMYYAGVDTDPAELEKLLGLPYDLIIIDESGSYTIDLQHMIQTHLEPALVDRDGELWMIGTPTNRAIGFYFNVTNGQVTGWSVHKWSALDNPHISGKFRRKMEQLKADIPGVESMAWFQQQYLGRWAIDISKLVYKFSRDRNIAFRLPEGRYRNLLGIDLGFSPDPSAFVVGSSRDYDPNLYFRHAYKRTEMLISDVAAYANHLDSIYNFDRMIIDGSNKQAVEELRQRHKLYKLEPAEKIGKVDFINLMNTDFELGRIQLLEGEADALIDEYQILVWDERAKAKGKYKEDESLPNHCCDGGLYVWRFSLNWVDRGAAPQAFQSADEEMLAKFSEESFQMQQEAAKPFWEQDPYS